MGLYVLHASAQLGSAEYINSERLMQSLERAFDWQLYDLQNESAADVNETVTAYLEENGWVASIGYLGNMAQSEWAASFPQTGAESGLIMVIATRRNNKELLLNPQGTAAQ